MNDQTAPRQTHPAVRLSVVVITYNMHRELPRTLHTLSAEYQTGVLADDYEVIVADNGSWPEMEHDEIASFGSNFRLLRLADPSHSPVAAVNLGLDDARGDNVAIMVDGARMLSPGIIFWTLEAIRVFENAVVTVPSWHIGPDVQNRSMRLGYNQRVEDGLLERIDWRGDGYRLFDCCERLDPSSEGAVWFETLAESNFVACSKQVMLELGGFDPRFTSRGGGACNLDFFARLVEFGCSVVSLFGEGTFHQIHGGVSTNVSQDDHPWPEIDAEYQSIRGRAWSRPRYDPIIFGRVSENAKKLLSRSPNIFTASTGNVPTKWLRAALGDLQVGLALKLLRRGWSRNADAR